MRQLTSLIDTNGIIPTLDDDIMEEIKNKKKK